MGKKSKSPSNKNNAVDDESHNDDTTMLPSMEISEQEYHDLVSQVQELSIQEAQEEWVEACRYGDVDVVRALVESNPSLIDFVQSESGNTGLHMASANGHTKVVKLLVIGYKHPFSKNRKGNSPLHWAAANGQAGVVEFLTTQKIVDVDVLDKNDFGRSALTEGFTSQKEDVVKSLLEHDSASEEKLLATDNNNTEDSNQLAHIHHFFNDQNPLKVRELAMKNADNPFADSDRPDQDTTGLSIWSASLVTARWMQDKKDFWKDCNVLELGSGCGVPGLAVAASSPRPRQVYLTDLNPQTVENLQHNIELNGFQEFVSAICMDWSDTSTWPEERVDVLIGSDLIYQKSLVPLLTSVVMGALKPGGSFFYVAPDTGRDGIDSFIETMKSKCPGWSEKVAPKEYHSNPLTNQDDEECFLHFQELSSLTYMLYEFPIPKQ
jgi:protein-L-isoaspartate O-methyltransferase